MPTTIAQPYGLEWRGRPPHMLMEDIPVWYRFLEREAPAFQKLYYDVLLGGPWLTPDEEKDTLKRMWRFNISKRADVVAETKDEVWIIEVALDPGMRSMGQLMTYKTLWLEDPVIDKTPVMVIVCQRLDPDLAASYGNFGARVFIV